VLWSCDRPEQVLNLQQSKLADKPGHVARKSWVDECNEDVPPQLKQVRTDMTGRFQLARHCVILVVPRLCRPDEVYDTRLQAVHINHWHKEY